MRLLTALILAGSLPAFAQDLLFRDTFDRPDSRNVSASVAGITDLTGSDLAAGQVYLLPYLDPANAAPSYGVQDGNAANGGGARIAGNALQLAVGAGTSNAYVNHNFTNAPILAAGGFSVSVDATGYNQDTLNQGAAFGIGMTAAEAASMRDAVGNGSNQPHLSAAFSDGFSGTGNAVADFWVAIRGNGSVIWGSGDTTLGTVATGSKTGRISARFSVPDFQSGSTVGFEVFRDTASLGSGTFTWSDTDANFIGLDARDNTSVAFDNLTVETAPPVPALVLQASPASVLADDTEETVTLSWTGSGLPADATYRVTAGLAVTFPSGGRTGPAANGPGSVQAVVDGTLGDTTFTVEILSAGGDLLTRATSTVVRATPPSTRPNVIVILADDLGWGDLGCYGGEIPTPHLDALAAGGARFRQFYQSARCSPTRCSILTGLYPQQAAVNPASALPDLRNDNNVTFAELLGSDGYRTYMAGKWHLGSGALLPENRGFQHVWRFTNGQGHSADCWNQAAYTLVSTGNAISARTYGPEFHQTDAIGDYALDFLGHHTGQGDGKPFAMYLAFGAPHFPLQAPAAMADPFMATYAHGWDVLRRERYDRQLATGVIDSRYPFAARGGTGPHQNEPITALPAWDTLPADRRADLTRRMALFAAMVKGMDDQVGRLVGHLRATGRLENTMIVFASDNGANHEGGVFGNNGAAPATGAALTNMGQAGQGDGIHYGGGWAHAGNSPLKLYKHFTHEGGTRSPAIVHWPAGLPARGTWVDTPAHLIDVMASIVDATGATYPASFAGHPVLPLEGTSLIDLAGGSVPDRILCVEHETNRSIRHGRWKLVTESFTAHDQEFVANQKLLYDMEADPGESRDLAPAEPAKVVELVDAWNAWATRVGLPAARQIAAPPVSSTPAPGPADLFLDTFNRPGSTDIDAGAAGMTGSRVPPLAAGAAWIEGWEGSGTADSILLTDSVLQLATGVGMSECGITHNFTGSDITAAGGFSVSLRILAINTDASDAANRFAGFGVGLNAAQAAAGNDIGGNNPPPIRGNTGNPGTADCFVELDLNGNVKLWADGILRATVPTGKTTGTLTAAFACDSFAAGAPVAVSAYLDGQRLDLDPAGPSFDRSFAWDEGNANHIALSARASGYVQVDNLAIRKLPLSTAMATEHSLRAGLEGSDADPGANPDGDRLDNFAEWAFGTDPARADDTLAATRLVLVRPSDGSFQFAHRRLTGHAAAGLLYRYEISGDLGEWRDVMPFAIAAAPLAASPGYEAATLAVPAGEIDEDGRLFLRVTVQP